MTPRTRLSTRWPDLEGLFEQASEDLQRRAAALSCQLALASCGIQSPGVDGVIQDFALGDVPTAGRLSDIERMRDVADDEYADLIDSDSDSEQDRAQHLFSKARAYSAVLFAAQSSREGMKEAIYEALISLPNPSLALNRLRELLSA
jgi:hypothetical protein